MMTMLPASESQATSANRNPPQRYLLLGCCLLACLLADPIWAKGQAQERLLKAAFVYNFAKFTQWPTSSFSDGEASLNLCLIGQDGLNGDLRRLDGRLVKGRTLRVKALDGNTLPDSCHMAYIARSEGSGLARQLAGRPVLSISQISHFSRSGGIIELYRRNGKIRFRINRSAAQRAGLSISSRLLKLADVVGG
ncbi:MAG: YfiR family protein [Gammaproteobacteria bacterium SHHR-1]